MAKLQILKARVQMAGRTVAMIDQSRNPEAEKRVRGRRWMVTRARWLSDHPLCVHCMERGIAKPATQLDHIIPLIDGGKDDDTNYQSLCYDCHSVKTAEEAMAR